MPHPLTLRRYDYLWSTLFSHQPSCTQQLTGPSGPSHTLSKINVECRQCLSTTSRAVELVENLAFVLFSHKALVVFTENDHGWWTKVPEESCIRSYCPFSSTQGYHCSFICPSSSVPGCYSTNTTPSPLDSVTRHHSRPQFQPPGSKCRVSSTLSTIPCPKHTR